MTVSQIYFRRLSFLRLVIPNFSNFLFFAKIQIIQIIGKLSIYDTSLKDRDHRARIGLKCYDKYVDP